MTKSPQPLVRLANHDVPNGELYNFYQLSSLMASFYLKGKDSDGNPNAQSLWYQASLDCLEQVAMAHKWWSLAEAQSAKGQAKVISVPLVMRARSLANRCLIAERYLNEWEFAKRWGQFASQMEELVFSYIKRLSSSHECVAQSMEAYTKLYERRTETLKTIQSLWITEVDTLNSSYAIPVAI